MFRVFSEGSRQCQGQKLYVTGQNHLSRKVRSYILEFYTRAPSGLPRRRFTLFIVMTGEGWNEIAINAMTLFPEDTSWAVALFFIVFVTFTNLMVMNLIIGVIVEKIMSSTREQDKEHSLKPTEKDFDVPPGCGFCPL